MKYSRFLLASVIGTMIWVTVFVMGGYYFGQIEWVRENFALAILIMAAVVVLPTIVGVLHTLYVRRRNLQFTNSNLQFRK
jgi:membrane-associated protein